MKAIVYTAYGAPDVLRLTEVEKPAPKDDEVLIKVRATTVTAGDVRVRSLKVPTGFGLISRVIFGISRPKQPVLGTELAGEIVAVGRNVTEFKAGDQVFGMNGARMGCYAEYKAMPADGPLALKPANLSYEEAAALSFGGTTALHFLRKANIQRGDHVLINGASSGVGTAAVQLARYFGARVTGVCSTANRELVSSLGADRVIDYTSEDFTKSGETYDIIMDIVDTIPFSRAKHSLKPGGRLLLVTAALPAMLQAPLVSLAGGKKVIVGTAAERAEDLHFLAELAQNGTFKPVIDRCYPLEQIVEAHRYVDTGRKKGNVVITLA
jgi:NADPH:quinone reductase-like Zn-dependent oxidoreductase